MRLAALSIGVVLCAGTFNAQAPSPPAPASNVAFEVVSIKPVAPGTYPPGIGGLGSTYRGRIFRMANANIASVVAAAFRSPERSILLSQVLGVPDAIAQTRFEIAATVSTDIGLIELAPQVPALLRTVLEDRFKLQAHIESRPFPVFALVRARADGRLGPQLHSVSVDCVALLREQLAKPAVPPTRPVIGALSPCSTAISPGRISATAITMRGLASSLRTASGRTVVDRTDLTGSFDLELQWSADALNADGPSVFTALQEQLGLKLESGEAPSDVVVIDHVELPTPN